MPATVSCTKAVKYFNGLALTVSQCCL